MELWNVEIALLIAIRLLPNENHCGLNIVLHVVYFGTHTPVDMAVYLFTFEWSCKLIPLTSLIVTNLTIIQRTEKYN
jgi:hypothetical protein